jgi:molybdate transport system regulatory protein
MSNRRSVPVTAKSTRTPAPAGVRGRIQLDKDGVSFLGPSRIDLLEAIAAHGSITRGAKAIGLSYKAAWDAVEAMNNQASSALVTRSAGGSKGGGTTLTEYGQQVIALVRNLEREQASILAALDDPQSALAAYTRLNRQLSLRTSARNQWVGRVVGVLHGTVRTQVQLAVGPGVLLRADISSRSAERLFIQVGMDICALVKATAVAVVPGHEVKQAPKSDNRILASVEQVRRDEEHMEITATMPGERTVTAVARLPKDRSERLERGMPLTVRFAPDQVLLVQLG